MRRKPMVMIFLIILAFMLFFSHQYTTFDSSQNSFTEFPVPVILSQINGSSLTQSESFNLYGSTLYLTEFANITFNDSITAGENIKVSPVLSITLLKVTHDSVPLIIKHITFVGKRIFNTTILNVSPGNYILNSSFTIYLTGVNKLAISHARFNIMQSLKGTILVNANLNSFPVVFAIPTYFFASLTIAFFILVVFSFKHDYDIRKVRK